MTLAPAQRPSGVTARRWWPWLKRSAITAFFGLVAWLLVAQARAIEWHAVFTALANYPLQVLLVAAALALLGLLNYSAFDLLGRRYTGHTLAAATVMRVTFISYVFNLNLGSMVGGVAMRYRLYTRLGLATGVITRVMSLSMLANWIGYLLLAGVVFGFHAPKLPPGWVIDSGDLQMLGFGLLALALLYLVLCALARERDFKLWGHALSLPSLRLALLQLGMGAANWLLMGSIIYVLLQQKIDFFTVVSVLLVAAVAGVIARIPAGLGVLEAVFIALLSPQVPKHELLAALLAYRLIYYLAPLALATLLYLVAEISAKKTVPPLLQRRVK
ncbi:MAG: lysylphosphatidylglycerol synthase domain-containing protein [Rhodoferax sp.]